MDDRLPAIKHLRFAPPGIPAEVVPIWTTAAAAALEAPGQARPVRVAICTALPDETPDPPHPVVTIAWFADLDHLGHFEQWLAAAGAREAPAASTVVAAEHVLRGDEWLATRWRRGGTSLKHMALARRAAGLTPAQFSERWQAHAGSVGTTPIPDAARGRAYAQNHPVLRNGTEWPYDAVNEVWFDDLEALRTRIRWLARADASAADPDLFGESRLFAVSEDVLA